MKVKYTYDDFLAFLEEKIAEDNYTDNEYGLYLYLSENGKLTIPSEFKKIFKKVEKELLNYIEGGM